MDKNDDDDVLLIVLLSKPMTMKKLLLIPLISVLFLSPGASFGQTVSRLRIEDCQRLAREQYPLGKQRELIDQTNAFTLSNLNKNYFPQATILGQATYQSDVTQVPLKIPGNVIPVLDKDQYKLACEINQVLFDGGVTRQLRSVQKAQSETESWKLETELYKLNDRVNQLFFGVLQTEAQLRQVELLQQDLQTGINRMTAALNNGTAYKSQADLLRAEWLKAGQKIIELESARKAMLSMLGELIHQPLSGQVVLEKPVMMVLPDEIKRPELSLFQSQDNVLGQQRKLLASRNLPRLQFFFQGGYARPALNMLSNEFDAYYLGGLRLQWNLGGFYTFKKEKGLIEISRQGIVFQKEAFLLNTRLNLIQQKEESNKMNLLMQTDKEIIALRENVTNVSLKQLEQGIITAGDYLREVNALDQARENRILHEIQWLFSIYTCRAIAAN